MKTSVIKSARQITSQKTVTANCVHNETPPATNVLLTTMHLHAPRVWKITTF